VNVDALKKRAQILDALIRLQMEAWSYGQTATNEAEFRYFMMFSMRVRLAQNIAYA
jgi:hypothetical protein